MSERTERTRAYARSLRSLRSLLHPPSKRVKIDLELIRLESGRAALAVGPHIPTVHELLTELLCGVVVGRRKREQRPWRMTKCRKALLGRLFHLTPSPTPGSTGLATGSGCPDPDPDVGSSLSVVVVAS
jgi:hypothetical protein